MEKCRKCAFCVHQPLLTPVFFPAFTHVFLRQVPLSCLLWCVRVCVCVFWRDIQSDGLTGGMILSEGCYFQTLLSSCSPLLFLFKERGGWAFYCHLSLLACVPFFINSHSLLSHFLCCIHPFASLSKLFWQNQVWLRRIDVHCFVPFLSVFKKKRGTSRAQR